MCSLTAGLIGASALFGYQQQVQHEKHRRMKKQHRQEVSFPKD